MERHILKRQVRLLSNMPVKNEILDVVQDNFTDMGSSDATRIHPVNVPIVNNHVSNSDEGRHFI